MKRILMPFAILAGAIVVAVLLVRNPIEVDETSPEVLPVAVRVLEAQLESVQLAVHSQGKVQAAQMVNLSMPVSGPVIWVSPALEPGGYIEAGQPLLRIDPSDYETVVARSRASLMREEAEAKYAKEDLRRIRGLAEENLASEAQLQDAERGNAVAAARLADAQASFNQAELDLRRTEIKAPFDAIINSKEVELGQFLNRAQSIAVLYGANEVEVRVPLALKQLGYLDIPLGLRGELDYETAPDVHLRGMYGGVFHSWHGKLVRVEASIDAASNSVQSIIRVIQPSATAVNPGKNKHIPLPIGLYVQAEISGKMANDIIVLPRNVIRNNNQVLVVDAENKLYYREVEIFRLEKERVLISSGILPGESICISPIQAIYNGMSVQPINELI
ncbi:MAG: efflux RND transporter periplasmic adaptor subunit [Gammaproteobacteria bacterium]|nr:efflux RND transporter periplasmic adaptor subunit [Gammaproteobacteria bacterium]